MAITPALRPSRYGVPVRSSIRSPLLAAAACFLAFGVVLAFAYTITAAGRVDAIALHGLTALDNSVSDLPAHVAVHSADPLPLLAMLGALFAWGWTTGRRREAVGAVGLVAAANLIGLGLKMALAHPRYHQILGGQQVGAEAFPSGHATTAMSIALAAVLVAPPRARVGVAFGAAAYVIAVATSLLVLSWHFPSDVLGGLLLSSGFFFLALAAVREGAGRRAGVVAQRARLALSPGLGGIGVALMAAAGLLALSRADELMAFARLHTVAAATALALMVISAGLVASATLIADRY
jgi:membrane-associated phospholipid phosphatase